MEETRNHVRASHISSMSNVEYTANVKEEIRQTEKTITTRVRHAHDYYFAHKDRFVNNDQKTDF